MLVGHDAHVDVGRLTGVGVRSRPDRREAEPRMSRRTQHQTQHKYAPMTKWAASTKNTWPLPARASSSTGSSLVSRNAACVAACSAMVFFGGKGMAAMHRHFRPSTFLICQRTLQEFEVGQGS